MGDYHQSQVPAVLQTANNISFKSNAVFGMSLIRVASVTLYGINVTLDSSQWQHIGNFREVEDSINKVDFIQLILNHNIESASFHYIAVTLPYIALQGGNNVDSANVFNVPFTTYKMQNQLHYLLFISPAFPGEVL